MRVANQIVAKAMIKPASQPTTKLRGVAKKSKKGAPTAPTHHDRNKDKTPLANPRPKMIPIRLPELASRRPSIRSAHRTCFSGQPSERSSPSARLDVRSPNETARIPRSKAETITKKLSDRKRTSNGVVPCAADNCWARNGRICQPKSAAIGRSVCSTCFRRTSSEAAASIATRNELTLPNRDPKRAWPRSSGRNNLGVRRWFSPIQIILFSDLSGKREREIPIADGILIGNPGNLRGDGRIIEWCRSISETRFRSSAVSTRRFGQRDHRRNLSDKLSFNFLTVDRLWQKILDTQPISGEACRRSRATNGSQLDRLANRFRPLNVESSKPIDASGTLPGSMAATVEYGTSIESLSSLRIPLAK